MSDLVTENPAGNAIDLVMAKNMADLLHRHYPGHMWAVSCDGKFADVRNLYLSGSWGFRIRVDFVTTGSDFDRKVMRAGGELLERYRLSRGKFNNDQLAALPTNFAGHLKADT